MRIRSEIKWLVKNQLRGDMKKGIVLTCPAVKRGKRRTRGDEDEKATPGHVLECLEQ